MNNKTVKDQLTHFLRSDSGAITTDWVVMAAAVVGLGLAATAAVRTGSGDLATDVNTSLTAASVASIGCTAPDAGTNAYACYSGPTITGQSLTSVSSGVVLCPMGGGACTAAPTVTTTTYHMSDGDVFTHQIVSYDTGIQEVTWRNRAGENVDVPPPNPSAPYVFG